MSVTGPGNCWDAIPGDEDFDNILNILDFPMESLEVDGLVSDWDITNSHCLGPIPSGVLMGPPTIPVRKLNPIPPCSSSRLISPVVGVQEQKPSSNLVKPQESSVFRTQSPVSVLESSGSCSGKNLPNTIPMRARSKRVKRRSSWLSSSTHFISNPRKDKGETRKLPAVNGNETKNPSQVTKRCTHCDVTKTPQWREGPLGPKTLCNACGVRFRSGRLFPEYRPAASPTFVPALHSNSHKKVVEMRTKGNGRKMEIEKGPASPQPEFVPMSNYLFDYIY